MPLSFDSLSHGAIAFGFFNIESDMLLLENYFFFAEDFCRHISHVGSSEDADSSYTFRDVYFIESSENKGDLMGAIYGVSYVGFIGDVYRRFPFPKREEDFKQKAEGYKNRGIIKELVAKYSRQIDISLVYSKEREWRIGDYQFSEKVSRELIEYVWMGGYPGWKDEIRPDYVVDMKRKIEKSDHPLFKGVSFNS